MNPFDPLDPAIFPLPRSQWKPDEAHKKCMSCNVKFSGGLFKSGKHHCRKCGFVICKDCCIHRLRKQIVCNKCYKTYSKFDRESESQEEKKMDQIPSNHSDDSNLNEQSKDFVPSRCTRDPRSRALRARTGLSCLDSQDYTPNSSVTPLSNIDSPCVIINTLNFVIIQMKRRTDLMISF